MAVNMDLAGFGEELAAIATDLQVLLARAQVTTRTYNTRGISPFVSALATDETAIEGTNFDKLTMQNTYFALEQFVKFMTGQAVVQGNYIDNIDKAAVLGTEV